MEPIARAGLSPDELDGWIDELQDAAGPALTANRTMGSLGGMVASRIAREFRIGGPSFTVSCDETSGIQALAIAAAWLERGELDAAIVGAVDLAGDARAVLARSSSGPRSGGAVRGRLVVKRLEDAQRDGDRIYAVIGDVAADGRRRCRRDRQGRGGHRFGNGRQGRLPGPPDSARCLVNGPRFWMRNRGEGPHRAPLLQAWEQGNDASLEESAEQSSGA